MATEPNKIIYSMIKVSKKYNQKQILKDISLSYFYGAKIGVLGLNGSGKSTLLRILAGLDKEHEGKTILSEGYTIDYLPQEPALDPEKTVREIVEEGAQATVDLLNEFNAINEQFAEPMDDDAMQALIDRLRCRTSSTPSTPGTWTRAWRWPWMPCAARPRRCAAACSPAARSGGWRCAASS